MTAKFFMPDWVLSSTSLTPGAKLVLCVLSTRSTETKEGRTSFGLGTGAIADLVGMHYVSVDRLIKGLVKEGYMKALKGGYLLIGEPGPAEGGEGVAPGPAEKATEALGEPVAPRDLFAGCYSMADCRRAMTAGFRLCDLEYSYQQMDGSAPHRDGIFELMHKMNETVNKKGLPPDHIFKISK